MYSLTDLWTPRLCCKTVESSTACKCEFYFILKNNCIKILCNVGWLEKYVVKCIDFKIYMTQCR